MRIKPKLLPKRTVFILRQKTTGGVTHYVIRGTFFKRWHSRQDVNVRHDKLLLLVNEVISEFVSAPRAYENIETVMWGTTPLVQDILVRDEGRRYDMQPVFILLEDIHRVSAEHADCIPLRDHPFGDIIKTDVRVVQKVDA